MADSQDESISSSTTFVDFLMDNNAKSKVLNIGQYSIMAIIPVVILNKMMQHIFPQIDESKNNFEITIEVCAQLIMLFIGLYFIDRSIRYFKTYSSEEYGEVSILNMILPFSILILSIQSKMGQKINIVVERLIVHFNIKQKDENKILVKQAQIPIENDMREIVKAQPIQESPEQTNGRVAMPIATMQQQQKQPSQEQPNFNQMYETIDSSGGFSSAYSAF